MPLARYFSFVGGVLLALLFVLDACFPKRPVAARTKVYPPVIRIYSDRKWPERIVYDTSLPTIGPSPVANAEDSAQKLETVAETSSGVKQRESFAMLPSPSADRLQASATRVHEPRPRRRANIVKKRAPTPSVAMARHQQFGWFERSFW
jgi:hypothetical protein